MIPAEEFKRIQDEALAGRVVRSSDILRLITEVIVTSGEVASWRDAAKTVTDSCSAALETLLEQRDEARGLVKELLDGDGNTTSRAMAAVERWGVGL